MVLCDHFLSCQERLPHIDSINGPPVTRMLRLVKTVEPSFMVLLVVHSDKLIDGIAHCLSTHSVLL